MNKKSDKLTPENFWVNDEAEIKEQTETEAEAEELFDSVPEAKEEEAVSEAEEVKEEMREEEIEEDIPQEDGEEPMKDSRDSDRALTYRGIKREEEEPAEAPEDEIKKLIQLLVIIGGIVLLVVLAAAILIFVLKTKKPVPDGDSQARTESASYESGEMWGVILSCDASVVKIYDAGSGETRTFDLNQAKNITDQYGQSMSVSLVKKGQIVQVQYNSANNQVEMFRLTSRAKEISGVSGVTVQDNQIIIEGTAYQYDKQLICLYQGKEYPIDQVTPGMIVKAGAIDNHLYTLQVISGSVWLEIQNIPEEYMGLELVLTPEKGEDITQVLEEQNQKVEVPEGLITYCVRKGNRVEEQGKILIVGNGKTQILALKTAGKKQGTIQFDINVTDGVTVTIEEKTYDASEEIVLPYGEYTAVIQAGGSEPMEIALNVTQPYQVMKVDINATTTKAIVSSSLSGTRLLLNGEYKTTLRGKPETFELEAGTYVFLAQNEGYEDMTITVTVRANMADQVIYFTGFQPVQPPIEESQNSEEAQESVTE